MEGLGGPLGGSWRRLGCVLEVSWAILGGLEASWRGLRSVLEGLGGVLEALGSLLEAS